MFTKQKCAFYAKRNYFIFCQGLLPSYLALRYELGVASYCGGRRGSGETGETYHGGGNLLRRGGNLHHFG